MIIERKKNAIRNIVWGVINKLVLIIFPFFIRTVLLKKLGVEYLGISSLFSSILQVLNLAELGFGSALVFSMYKPIAEDDTKLICELLNSYRKVYATIGGIIFIIGICMCPLVPHIIKGEWPNETNVYIIYFIYLLNTVVSYFTFAYKASLLLAHNRNDIMSKISSSIMITQYLVQIVILFWYPNFYLYILVMPVFTILLNLIQALLVTKMYPEYICQGNISDSLKKEILKRVCGLASYKIYGVVFSSVDTIVISAFLGLMQVGIYNNYYYIITSVGGFLLIITNSITAGIGNSLIVESKRKNYQDFKQLVFMNVWITGWCAICMMVLFQSFITLWVGDDFLLSYITVYLLVLSFYISRSTTITFLYREALGLWWEDKIRPLVATVVNLILNIILVQNIGINGVIISTIACSVCINIPWGTHTLFKNYFKDNEKIYYIDIIKYFVVCSCAGALTYYCAEKVTKLLGNNIGYRVLICIIVPNLCFILCYYKKQEFKNMYELCKSIIKNCI